MYKRYSLRVFPALITALFLAAFPSFAVAAEIEMPNDRSGVVTFDIDVKAPADSTDVKLWLPYPVTNEWQTIEDVVIEGNFTRSGIYAAKENHALTLYAEWSDGAPQRTLRLSFKAKALERVEKDFPGTESSFPVDVDKYLKSTYLMPTDGKIGEIGRSITRWKWGTKAKARAVYDWVVDNTHRDPDVIGCGKGDVLRTLNERGGGGKCADISSVFVAVARAAGIPAREVFGLRLGEKPEQDITGGHHCWAEFYLPDYGWVPVDPADVRKMMHAEKLELGDADAERYREYFFGAVDPYRIALARGGRGFYLSPPQRDGAINYFMYPYAEVDGRALDWPAQGDLSYRVTFKEL